MKTYLLQLITILLLAAPIKAQRPILPLNFQFSQNKLAHLYRNTGTTHTFVKPFFTSKFTNLDSTENRNQCTKQYSNRFWNYMHRKLLHENFLLIDSPGWTIAINPLFNFEVSKDVNESKKYYINTRGVEFCGRIGKTNFILYRLLRKSRKIPGIFE